MWSIVVNDKLTVFGRGLAEGPVVLVRTVPVVWSVMIRNAWYQFYPLNCH